MLTASQNAPDFFVCCTVSLKQINLNANSMKQSDLGSHSSRTQQQVTLVKVLKGYFHI